MAHLVPAESVVVVQAEELNGDRLIAVLWAEKLVMMFTQDIRTDLVKREARGMTASVTPAESGLRLDLDLNHRWRDVFPRSGGSSIDRSSPK